MRTIIIKNHGFISLFDR